MTLTESAAMIEKAKTIRPRQTKDSDVLLDVIHSLKEDILALHQEFIDFRRSLVLENKETKTASHALRKSVIFVTEGTKKAGDANFDRNVSKANKRRRRGKKGKSHFGLTILCKEKEFLWIAIASMLSFATLSLTITSGQGEMVEESIINCWKFIFENSVKSCCY